MNVVVAVCGSISAYKSYDIVRSFVKNGDSVQVVLTQGALRFINADTYKYLGVNKVHRPMDDFENYGVLHVELSKWANKIVIAPLSANTLSKLCHGFAEDLLQSLFLATDESTPIIMYPAMNTKMLNNPIIKKNIESLKSLPNVFIHRTDSGELACGDIGEGKLVSVEEVYESSKLYQLKKTSRKVLITTGATTAPIDNVRYVTNPSSGLTGLELAKEFLKNGDDVVVVAGKASEHLFSPIRFIPNFTLCVVSTTEQMKQEVFRFIDQSDLYISSAAICDLKFKESNQKLKKNDLQGSLAFEQAEDILKSVLDSRKEKLKVIGFAAESPLNEEVLKEKWNRKKVDLLIGNEVNSGLTGGSQLGFSQGQGQYTFFSDGEIKTTSLLSKQQLAEYIVSWSQ